MVTRSSRGSFTQPTGGAFDGAQDADMAAAAADIVVERLGDLFSRRRRVAVEQRLGRDQNAGQAVAPLPRLLIDKGLLQRMRTVRRAQALDRHDFLAGDGRERLAAGFLRFAVDQHHAASALLEPAAEFGPHQTEVVAQDVEQRRFRLRRCADGISIYDETNSLHWLLAGASRWLGRYEYSETSPDAQYRYTLQVNASTFHRSGRLTAFWSFI